MIAIVSAFPKETSRLRAQGKSVKKEALPSGSTIYTYSLLDIPIVTLSLGMGIDSSRLKAEELLGRYANISHLILTGIAGGFTPHTPGTVIIPSSVTLWSDGSETPTYSLSGESGVLVTASSVVEHSVGNKIRKVYPNAVGVDMEGATVAEVCLRYGVSCTIIRGISDSVDSAEGSDQQYRQYGDLALQRATDKLLCWLSAHGRFFL